MPLLYSAGVQLPDLPMMLAALAGAPAYAQGAPGIAVPARGEHLFIEFR
jgi:hypothetical protein